MALDKLNTNSSDDLEQYRYLTGRILACVKEHGKNIRNMVMLGWLLYFDLCTGLPPSPLQQPLTTFINNQMVQYTKRVTGSMVGMSLNDFEWL